MLSLYTAIKSKPLQTRKFILNACIPLMHFFDHICKEGFNGFPHNNPSMTLPHNTHRHITQTAPETLLHQLERVMNIDYNISSIGEIFYFIWNIINVILRWLKRVKFDTFALYQYPLTRFSHNECVKILHLYTSIKLVCCFVNACS